MCIARKYRNIDKIANSWYLIRLSNDRNETNKAKQIINYLDRQKGSELSNKFAVFWAVFALLRMILERNFSISFCFHFKVFVLISFMSAKNEHSPLTFQERCVSKGADALTIQKPKQKQSATYRPVVWGLFLVLKVSTFIQNLALIES